MTLRRFLRPLADASGAFYLLARGQKDKSASTLGRADRILSPEDKHQHVLGVVVKIRVPFWVPNIIRHQIFRVPKKGALILTTTHEGFRF